MDHPSKPGPLVPLKLRLISGCEAGILFVQPVILHVPSPGLNLAPWHSASLRSVSLLSFWACFRSFGVLGTHLPSFPPPQITIFQCLKVLPFFKGERRSGKNCPHPQMSSFNTAPTVPHCSFRLLGCLLCSLSGTLRVLHMYRIRSLFREIYILI